MIRFRETYTTPYDQYRFLAGHRIKVVGIIDTPDADHDAEVLPMYVIQFLDGREIEAWPEEVIE